MGERTRLFLAEMFGTFVLVAVAAGAVCSAELPGASRYYAYGGVLLAAALAYGAALAVAVSFTTYHSPGCCNPAITLALYITRKLDGGPTAVLILAQLAGSFLAGLLLRSVYPEAVLEQARLGAPHLRGLAGPDGLSLAAVGLGLLLEAGFTFVVTLAAFATLIDRRAPRVGGLGLGLAQLAVVLVGFNLTGGSANPARWFGPAVWQLSLASLPGRPLAGHAAYWAGPVAGAIAAAAFYVSVILPPGKKSGG